MKNGIKILNLEGADVFRNNVEDNVIKLKYEAVFANSLLKDKLEKGEEINRLIVKDFATKDIINLKFNMPVTNIDKEKYSKYKNYIDIKDDKNKSDKIGAKNIREILYKEGFKLEFDKEKTLKGSKKEGTRVIEDYKNRKYILIKSKELKDSDLTDEIKTYVVKDKKTNKDKYYKIIEEEKIETYEIKYKHWFRSSAKARVGESLFISERLYDNIVKWQSMGIELPEDEEAMVVEMMAYMALTASAIEDYIEINPNNILVISDLKSRRLINCAKVIVNDKKQCEVIRKGDYVENILFDGQALMDDSLFGESEAGMKLLRHHYFKACAFRTNIKLFMEDYCKENELDYEIASVKDRYGNDIKLKDIRLITTENAMKWEKFFEHDKLQGFNCWKKAVSEDCNLFGVCKEDHESKFKDKQRMSYQMLNTLPVSKEELTDIARYSIDYINNLKNTDNKAFIEYLKENKNIRIPNEMMVDLYERNEEFAKTELFKDFKAETIHKLKKNLRKGKVLVNADNLTIVGNPYLMLLHSVRKVEIEDGYVITEDETLPKAENYISVYTKRFENQEELVGFRNPHNSPNNIAYFKNNINELMNKYFNFSKNIMAINCIETEIQDLANSCDFDSDFMFTTNNKNIVKVVKDKIFRKDIYACIVNEIPQSKKKYTNTLENKAIIDNTLAKGKYDIGTSSNQAQIAMSLFANSDCEDVKLLDNVIILSVLAQVAIDNAKRQYEVELGKEIERLSSKGKRPLFFYYTSKNTTTEYKIYDSSGKCKGTYKNKYKAKEVKDIIIKKYKEEHKDTKLKDEEIAIIKEKSKKKNEDSFDENVKCTMNDLQDIISKEIINESKVQGIKIKVKDLVENVKGKAKHEQQEKIIGLVENWNKSVKKFYESIKKLSDEEIREKKSDFEQEEEYLVELIVEKIKKMSMTGKTINSLILSTLRKDSKNSNSHIRLKLLNVLYQSKRTQFLNQFKENKVS